MIDVEKAIQAGKAMKEAKEKKKADEFLKKAELASQARKAELDALQATAQRIIEDLPARISSVVAYGGSKVELSCQPSRILTKWNNQNVQPKDVPELWLVIIEEFKKHGIKAQIMHCSYEDNRYNDWGGVEDSWTQYYSYIGIDVENYKL